MALRLTIVSPNGQSMGDYGHMQFGETGGTIGRSLEADWVLPDGNRFLSSRHASIDFRSGSYYIIDLSKNGVYVNTAEQPVGRGKPQRLFTGDRVRLGDYEMIVDIDEVDGTREQMVDMPHIDPVDRAQRVEAPEPTGKDLVDAFEVTGVGLEELLKQQQGETLTPLDYKFRTGARKAALSAPPKPAKAARSAPPTSAAPPASPPLSLADDTPPASSPPANAPPASRAPRAAAAKPAAAAPKSATPAARATPPSASAAAAAKGMSTTAGALAAFFRGAAMPAPALDPAQAERMMLRLGQIVREIIVGLTENLQVRTAHKTVLHQSHTTMQPLENNALKFSTGIEESFDILLFRESKEYLSSVESVRAAFGDIRDHQRLLMRAMAIAVGEYIAELEPAHLEEKFASQRQGVLGAATVKFKYWDMYKELYEIIAQQSHGELPDVFRERLANAYEAERERASADETGDEPDAERRASAG